MRFANLFALVAISLALTSVATPGQTLTVRSAIDGQASSTMSPFVRTEPVEITLTGAEPFRQFILAYGSPSVGLAIPDTQGNLLIQPAGLMIAGLFATDAMGEFSIFAAIPASYPIATPPDNIVLQVLVNQDPLGAAANGLPWRFTNSENFIVGDPAQNLAVTEVVGTTPGATPINPGTPGVAPAIIDEGAGTQLLVRGTFVTGATVVPDVRFVAQSPCAAPGTEAFATAVAYVDDPGNPGQVALLVTAPALLGVATAPPISSAGLVDVIVDYSGLFAPGHVPPSLSTSAGTLPVFRSPFTPAIAVDGISPMANLAAGGCPVTITGSDFLDCAEVIFDVAGTATPGTGVVVVDANTIQVTPPGHAEGLVAVRVVNPDLVESNDASFAYFDPILGSVDVTAITDGVNTPASLVEGTGGAPVTATVSCPFVGPAGSEYTALDARSGTTPTGDIQLALGSNLGGTDAAVAVMPTSVTVIGPGVVEIVFDAPDLPPGLIVPAALSAGGSTNTGAKVLQITPPVCVNTLLAPHDTLTNLAATEVGNRLEYLAAAAPAFLAISPAPCGRVDGGQDFVITGTGFLTNDPVVPSTNGALAAVVTLSGGSLTTPTAFQLVSFDSDTQITVRSIDLSANAATVPTQVDHELVNPDGQGTGAMPFGFAASVADAVASAPLTLAPGVVNDLDTTPGGIPNVFNVQGDLVIPAGTTIRASGQAPLIIRCRGNVTLGGTIELRGDTYTVAAPAPGNALTFPAGGAPGGLGFADDVNQPMFRGFDGMAPLDPAIMPVPMPYPGRGEGGLHSAVGNGGGGGGMATPGFPGDPASGGAGGQAYGFTSLPIPLVPTTFPPSVMNVLAYLLPPGGSGGGAGGLGIVAPPYSSAAPPPNLAQNGGGGDGGGAVLIAADGIITIDPGAVIDCSGTDGGMGSQGPGPSGTLIGGGGGGGSGGGLLLQALQGIEMGGTLMAIGGQGGLGGGPGGQAGGGGSDGMIRLALPAVCPQTPNVTGTAMPAADTTTF